MLDMRYIRDHVAEVKENARRRRVTVDIDELVALDDRRLVALKQVEEVLRERNEVAERMKSATQKSVQD